jgi:hypothetical protein
MDIHEEDRRNNQRNDGKMTMKKRNLLLIPSHGRPERLRTCLNSVWKNSTNTKTLVILHETQFEMYLPFQKDSIESIAKNETEFIYTQHIGLVDRLTIGSTVFGKYYDYVSFIGDDCVVATGNWDQICINYIEENFGGFGVVSPGEPEWGRTDELPLHWMQSTSFWKTVGYFVHPSFKHCWIDNHLLDLAKSVGRYAKLNNCIVEHHHRNFGHPSDENYILGEGTHFWQDQIRYNELKNSQEYQETLERLKRVVS